MNTVMFQLYQERVIPLLMAHCPPKLDVFPQILVEGIACESLKFFFHEPCNERHFVKAAIIIGYDFHDQLNNDAFMIHELKVAIEKQLRADFEVLRHFVKAAIIIGYDFHDQLNNDAFMIHELKVTIEKQLRADFEVLRSIVKAVTESVSG
ncbi:hypothetical protein COOONC_09126 [Cooperia oncophora]